MRACWNQTNDPGVARPAIASVAAVYLGFAMSISCAHALDGNNVTPAPAKTSPENFTSTQQALRAGVDDLQAGDAKSSVRALTYAAEGGSPLACWKLGSMYASGDLVPRNDVLAYKYFEQLVDSYNEDDFDRREIGAVSNAFVAIGAYSLTGIPNSPVKPDPERALAMFQYAATNFGDAEAQYRLARMYLDGAAGLGKDNMRAARWLALASEKGHHGAQALLGHLLFLGEGVPRQRAKGLMWLNIAKTGAKTPGDSWIHDLQSHDFNAASEDDRDAATVFLSARGKDVKVLAGGLVPPRLAPAAPSAAPAAAARAPTRLSGAIAAPAGEDSPETAPAPKP